MFSKKEDAPGLIMVFTGDGKGKTTTAVGQALRAVGHGYRVFMIQFMKGRDYGEVLASQQLPNFTLEKAGRDVFVKRGEPDPVDVEMARKGWEKAQEAAESDQYHLLILDELNVALSYGLLPQEEVIDFLKNQKLPLGVIITGREASEEVMELADLVSEVKEIKHHYTQGFTSLKGIEF